MGSREPWLPPSTSLMPSWTSCSKSRALVCTQGGREGRSWIERSTARPTQRAARGLQSGPGVVQEHAAAGGEHVGRQRFARPNLGGNSPDAGPRTLRPGLLLPVGCVPCQEPLAISAGDGVSFSSQRALRDRWGASPSLWIFWTGGLRSMGAGSAKKGIFRGAPGSKAPYLVRALRTAAAAILIPSSVFRVCCQPAPAGGWLPLPALTSRRVTSERAAAHRRRLRGHWAALMQQGAGWEAGARSGAGATGFPPLARGPAGVAFRRRPCTGCGGWCHREVKQNEGGASITAG